MLSTAHRPVKFLAAAALGVLLATGAAQAGTAATAKASLADSTWTLVGPATVAATATGGDDSTWT
ncbi:hypothetical protein [Kitasatospora sp. NPDC018619]|uniref:hypothetical protein n=1 Tax=unclassified Kitasatospora TaxID=2633591 RepID=UPI0037B1D06A